MADSPTPVNPNSNPEVPSTTTETVPVTSVDTAPTAIASATDPTVTASVEPVIPAADVATDANAVSAATNPEVPQVTVADVTPLAPPPDAAYLEAQATQKDRWQQAAATNPEGINNNGSVTTDLGGGQKETVNRDGSYSISGANGTYYYDAAGQQTAYTTPTVDGLSITTTTDGIQYTNYSVGGLYTSSTITKDGQPISTTVTYDAGDVRLSSTQVSGGEIVNSASTIVEGDKVSGYTIAEAVQVGDGEIITQTTKTPAYEELRQAYDANAAANEALTADALRYKQQLAEGLPPDPTQVAYLGAEAAAAEQAADNLAAAEENLAATTPLYVSPVTDPQISNPVVDTTPILDTEVTSTPVDPVDNPEIPQDTFIEVPIAEIATAEQITQVDAAASPEVPQFLAVEVPISEIATAKETAQVDAAVNPEVPQVTVPEVPVSEIATAAETTQVDAAADPEVPQTSDLPPPIEYVAAEPPTADPIVVAQADTVVTDVPITDVEVNPADVTVEQVSDQLVDLNTGEVYGIDPETGFIQSGDQVYIDPAEIPVTQRGDYLVNTTTGESYGIDPASGFVQSGEGVYTAPEDLPVEQQGDRLVDLTTGQTYAIDTETGFVNQGGIYVAPDEIPVEQQGDQLVDLTTGQSYGVDPETGFVDNGQGLYVSPEDIPVEREGDVLVDLNSGQEYPIDPDSGFVSVDGIYTSPEDLADKNNADLPEGSLVEFTPEGDVVRSPQELAAQQSQINQAVKNAQAQATLAQQMRQANSGDWRVKLRLAPGANYLYRYPDGKGTGAGILQPLAVTDGVIFPYTPQITTAYRANYSSYDLTHSNYRGYLYQGSYVDDVQIQATFTAQDSAEAKYLLAVIHFFRSITKMFYGQDPERGAPPPLVFLQGLGQYQFNLHPCVVAQFNYNLPADVDYIRADSPNIYNTNLLNRRDRQTVNTSPFLSAWQRLKNAGATKGALPTKIDVPVLGTDSPTYVPTKIDITLILHPVQSRQQVSNTFSLQKYASGDLIKGGTNQPGAFW